MAGEKTKFVRVRYDAVLEFNEEQDGIPDDSVLTQAARIGAHGVLHALGKKKGLKLVRGISSARYNIGLYYPPVKKPRKPRKKARS